MAISSAMRQDIMELAVLMNNKAPGTKLLGELVTAANSGKTLEQIAETLAAKAEFTAKYPLHQTAEEFGQEWISNILPEADAALQAECVKIVEAHINGGGSVAGLAVAVQVFMSDSANADGDLKVHIDNFNNKVSVATYHTITQEAVEGWEIPASVTSDPTTVTTGNASVDSALAPASATPTNQTFSLTTNTDNITGGDGNDTVNASSTTLNSDDQVNLGAGADTLTVAAAGAGNILANFQGIETVKGTNTAGNYQMNMIAATDVDAVVSRLSSAQVTYNNLQNLTSVEAYGVTGGSVLEANYTNSLASGTSDSLTLKADAGSNVVFEVSGVTDTNEFETINVESNGSLANTVAVRDAGGNAPASLGTLNVSGAAALTMTLQSTKAKATFDASSATGKQTITWGGGTTTLKGGSADDLFNASAGSFLGATNPKTVTGNGGTDTLRLTENVANLTSNTATQPHVIDVDTINYVVSVLEADNANKTRTLAADKISNESTVAVTISNLDTGNTDQSNAVITGITDEAITATSTEAAAQAVTSLSVALKTATGTADSLTVTMANPGAAAVNQLDTLTFAGNTEIANIVNDSTDVLTARGTTITALAAGQSNTINLSGAGGLTITALEIADPAGTAVGVINASGTSGKFDLGAAATDFKTTNSDGVAITLGSGTNNVHFLAEALATDSVTGTTGAKDAVHLLEGNDSGTATEFTLANIDTVAITPSATAGHDGPFSAKKWSDVGNIKISSAAHTAAENASVTNISSGQAIELNTATGRFNTDVITLTNATGVSGLAVTLKGTAGTNGAAGVGITTNAGTVNITDSVADATGFAESSAVTLAGTGATAPVTGVTLSGGGASGALTTAAFTLAGTSNVNLASIDASGLASTLDISGVTTAAGSAITLGSGNDKITIAPADLALDAIVLNAGDGTDTVVTVNVDAAAALDLRPGLTSVEALDITTVAGGNGANTITYNMTDSTGLATVTLTVAGDDNVAISKASGTIALKLDGNQAAATNSISLPDATGLNVTNTAAVGNTQVSDLTAAKATTLSIKNAHASNIAFDAVTVAKATDITLGGGGKAGTIAIATLSGAAATTLTIDASDGTVTIPTLTANKLTTLNISGDNAVSVGATAATTAALKTVSAGTATAAVTIGGAVDLASGASVTTGTANDALTLDVLTEMNSTVDMGTKTSDNDTLTISGTNNLGLTVIDLTAADQIGQVNGALNSASQTEIESVNLSGLTGTFGASINAGADANTIVGSPNADAIVAGGGIDTITAGDGVDTINLTETTAKADTLILAQSVALNDNDVVTGFGTTDIVQLDKSAFALNGTASAGNAIAAGTYYEGAAGAAVAATAYDVVVLTGASYANVGAAEDAVAARITSATDGFVIFHVTGTTTAMMYFDADMAADGNLTNTAAVLTFNGVADAAGAGTLFSTANFELVA